MLAWMRDSMSAMSASTTVSPRAALVFVGGLVVHAVPRDELAVNEIHSRSHKRAVAIDTELKPRELLEEVPLAPTAKISDYRRPPEFINAAFILHRKGKSLEQHAGNLFRRGNRPLQFATLEKVVIVLPLLPVPLERCVEVRAREAVPLPVQCAKVRSVCARVPHPLTVVAVGFHGVLALRYGRDWGSCHIASSVAFQRRSLEPEEQHLGRRHLGLFPGRFAKGREYAVQHKVLQRLLAIDAVDRSETTGVLLAVTRTLQLHQWAHHAHLILGLTAPVETTDYLVVVGRGHRQGVEHECVAHILQVVYSS
eukprot:Opistho-2@63233